VPVQDRVDRARLRKFGRRVRQLRREKELSQEQLAHLAGLHRAEVGFVERAEREIGLLKVWRLADALDVEAGDLFSR
jgi:transcriptional regulator with XRE-family HTH domain